MEMREFKATDRCDRCGARAYHVATKPGKPDLLFCNHHHRAHRDKLIEDYWLIESDALAEEPAYTE